MQKKLKVFVLKLITKENLKVFVLLTIQEKFKIFILKLIMKENLKIFILTKEDLQFHKGQDDIILKLIRLLIQG